jgi:sulfur-carrier protein
VITIQIRFFASLREALGAERSLSIAEGSTVAQVRAALVAQGEAEQTALAETRPVRAALNQTMVSADAVVKAGDELAFFPPVTGG